MKINVSFDITPEELREFLGLPEVKPIQDEMLEKVRERILAGVEGSDPMTLMRPFLTPDMSSIDSMQRAFWQAFGAGAGNREDSLPAKGKKRSG